jgi:polysaccharide deacetylase family protein (PEP-CTERM system associated)
VALAQSLGHEIASHGYAHRLVYQLKPSEFFADALEARKIIEDAAGHEVQGYRASGFSITQETPWFFEELARAGYRYDTSVFPASRGHGGLPGAAFAPHTVPTGCGNVVEFPITVTKLLEAPLCLFGGGYLRLAPWAFIRKGTARVLREGRPVVFYVHPREVDPQQPRLDMNRFRYFKSYVNLATTAEKVRRILSEFQFETFADYLREHSQQLALNGVMS